MIVTWQSWRVIFWLQTGLAGIASIGAYFLLPETIHHKKADDLIGLSRKMKAKVLWGMTNPWRVVKLYRYSNLIMVAFASSSLVWNMYSLLTPIRYVLNPRFHLTSPIQSGLFYLAPGCGYIVRIAGAIFFIFGSSSRGFPLETFLSRRFLLRHLLSRHFSRAKPQVSFRRSNC